MQVRRVCTLLVVFLAATGWELFAQRADRATVTGIVNDPSGSPVAGATVRIRSDDTGVETVLTTNESGAYTSPLLVLGTYTVTVEHSGFKTSVRSAIGLTGGRDYRIGLSVQDEAPASARLVWAEARKPPTEPPPELPLYDAL